MPRSGVLLAACTLVVSCVAAPATAQVGPGLADLNAVPEATLATMPVDNAAAGLPPAASIVNNVVSSVAVESGAIQVTFGNRANAALRGKVLSFRPGVVEASPMVPITWVCGHASPPVPMNARGLDKTNVPDRYLPLNCRAAVPAP